MPNQSNLNEKIAKWCGFSQDRGDTFWKYPIEKSYPYRVALPNFTESMDAIIKWVVPKLKLEDIAIGFNPDKSITVQICIKGISDYKFFNGINNLMPMAFCLALEKYIDSLSKDGEQCQTLDLK